MSEFINLLSDYLTTGYKDLGNREQGTGNSSFVSNQNLNQQDKLTSNTPFSLLPSLLSSPDSLEQIAEDIRVCKNCPLYEKRTNTVPGEGCASPLVMVIGEGPGEDEDAQGRPFVGKAGQLLDKMLASINLSRNENAYIANTVKCRPPNNRNPLPEETAACANFLRRQIIFLKPKFILLAGKVAAHSLLKSNDPIGKLRGKFYNLKVDTLTIPAIATYHPAALLRDESYKRPAWEDLKLLKARLVGSG